MQQKSKWGKKKLLRKGGISSLWVIRSFLPRVCKQACGGIQCSTVLFELYYTNTGPKEVSWITSCLGGQDSLLVTVAGVLLLKA